MKALAILVCVLACLGTETQAREYHGADQGMLVVSLGMIAQGNKPSFDSYMMNYKVAGTKTDTFLGEPSLSFSPVSYFHAKDFTGRELGRVEILHLKPGNYEIYSSTFHYVQGVQDVQWGSHKDFSIPFTIKPGETTYIGAFLGVTLYDGMGFPANGYLVLSDRHDRDIEIAKKKEPGLFPVTMQVSDPQALQIPGIVAKEGAAP